MVVGAAGGAGHGAAGDGNGGRGGDGGQFSEVFNNTRTGGDPFFDVVAQGGGGGGGGGSAFFGQAGGDGGQGQIGIRRKATGHGGNGSGERGRDGRRPWADRGTTASVEISCLDRGIRRPLGATPAAPAAPAGACCAATGHVRRHSAVVAAAAAARGGSDVAGAQIQTLSLAAGAPGDGSVKLEFLQAPTAPQITSAGSLSVLSSTGSVSFAVTATGLPAPSFSLSGAPSWLSIDPQTGMLSGRSRRGLVGNVPVHDHRGRRDAAGCRAAVHAEADRCAGDARRAGNAERQCQQSVLGDADGARRDRAVHVVDAGRAACRA